MAAFAGQYPYHNRLIGASVQRKPVSISGDRSPLNPPSSSAGDLDPAGGEHLGHAALGGGITDHLAGVRGAVRDRREMAEADADEGVAVVGEEDCVGHVLHHCSSHAKLGRWPESRYT